MGGGKDKRNLNFISQIELYRFLSNLTGTERKLVHIVNEMKFAEGRIYHGRVQIFKDINSGAGLNRYSDGCFYLKNV